MIVYSSVWKRLEGSCATYEKISVYQGYIQSGLQYYFIIPVDENVSLLHSEQWIRNNYKET